MYTGIEEENQDVFYFFNPCRDYICNLPMSREININLRVSQEKLELVSGKAIHAACTKGILWRGRQEQS